jgi:hypothetical protein
MLLAASNKLIFEEGPFRELELDFDLVAAGRVPDVPVVFGLRIRDDALELLKLDIYSGKILDQTLCFALCQNQNEAQNEAKTVRLVVCAIGIFIFLGPLCSKYDFDLVFQCTLPNRNQSLLFYCPVQACLQTHKIRTESKLIDARRVINREGQAVTLDIFTDGLVLYSKHKVLHEASLADCANFGASQISLSSQRLFWFDQVLHVYDF